MVVTKQFVEEQIQSLKKRLDQLQADGNACNGAIQAFQLVINQLEKADERDPDAPEARDEGGDLPT